MPYPQYIRTYYQTTMMPKVPQSMGFYYGHPPPFNRPFSYTFNGLAARSTFSM